ncbi:MAG: LysM peptidoglycan-binding domain-containing M23 family metallopeptidase [Synergistaceae bacterium]|nr:LysM peptidoglycan-binding domain-containing M23 family metallopeptidase [Synergistaceae bacterium]
MNIRKRRFFIAILVAMLSLTYSCVSHAARNAGAYWSGLDSGDSEYDFESGYVVVDAIDVRAVGNISGGIGPFLGDGPLFSEEETILEEEYEEAPQPDPADAQNSAETGQPAESPYWKEIKVASGETLSKISEKNDMAIKHIMTANELTDQHKLRQGQQLYIPLSPDFVPETLAHVKKLKEDVIEKRKQAAPLKITNYVIKNGDTLWNVANAFNLDVNSLFGSNKISGNDILKVGNTIRIPNQDGIFVKIKPGQTVSALAKEYGIYMEAILSSNALKEGAALTQGAEIFLPGAKVAAFVESAGGRRTVVQEPARRGFGWPVVGKISSPFGRRRDPVRGGRDFHTGLDIRAPRGRQIVAAAAGKIVHSGWMGGYGRTIVISHSGNTTTLYGHCSKLLVPVGKTVKRGDRIALVGSTGRSTGNHLHFEVRKGGTPMNPLKVLR